MLFYEIKINYQRQTGEDNPGNVRETYLVEGISCADVENRLLKDIQPFIFGEYEVPSCKKTQFVDIFPLDGGEFWFKGRAEMITIDNDKEIRRPQNFLIQASSLDEAVQILKRQLNSYDCEIISAAKSPIMDVIRANR